MINLKIGLKDHLDALLRSSNKFFKRLFSIVLGFA